MAAKHFSVVKLHQWQVNVITATVEGKDTLVVQPTGSGKSLCFCIPPLQLEKTAVVVSPTISLMTDQVRKLKGKGIPATLLGSAQKEDVTGDVEAGKFRVVFTTPECFMDKATGQPRATFTQMAMQNKIGLVAVDEAHLIHSWKSFRYIG